MQLKAYESVSKLANLGLIEESTLTSQVWPEYLHLISQQFEEDQSYHYFSSMFAPFLFNVSRLDEELVQESSKKLIKVYTELVYSKDSTVQLNAVKNFPCMFQLFVDSQDDKSISHFLTLLNHYCDKPENELVALTAGTFIHEIINLCEMKKLDPIEFMEPIVKLLKSTKYKV